MKRLHRIKNTQSQRSYIYLDRRHLTRNIVITRANGLCERYGKVGTEVHHITRLTLDNVDDVSISINLKNPILLCKDCYNKEHARFTDKSEVNFNENGDYVIRNKSRKSK